MDAAFWPGDQRAGALFSGAALLTAMISVEQAWLDELVACGVAEPAAGADLAGLLDDDSLRAVAEAAEDGGTAVIPLVAALRDRLDPPAARWLHRGLTSQDVSDTAVMLCARDLTVRLQVELATQLTALAALIRRHRDDPMVARTLTQHALPYLVGAKFADWTAGLLDACVKHERATCALPVQLGGAVGTRAALLELLTAALPGTVDGVAETGGFCDRVAGRLGLSSVGPWHTRRAPVLGLGEAWCALTAAWGRIANDVLTLSRPEIGELAEAPGHGGSSAMPHKANPARSVLVRRAALAAPLQVAQLQLAAAEMGDERPDGAWHLEWPALQLLARRTVAAAAHTSDLLTGLRVDTERMARTLAAATEVDSEQRAMQQLTGRTGGTAYLGTAQRQIDDVLGLTEAMLTTLNGPTAQTSEPR